MVAERAPGFVLHGAAPALRLLGAFADCVGKTHSALQRYTPPTLAARSR